jgi:hypothetical protein
VPKLIDSSAVALTPVDSIAKPTISSAHAEVTTKAAPASSPNPTVAPLTFPSQAQVSSKTGSLEQSSRSAERPSPSQASDVADESDSADNDEEQVQGNDQDDNTRPSSSSSSGVPLTPAKDDTVSPTSASRPAEPNAGLSGTFPDDNSSTGKNALSILSEALVSAKAADPVISTDPTLSGAHASAKAAGDLLTSTHSGLSDALSSARVSHPVVHADPNDFAQSSHDEAPSGDPAEETELGTTTLATAVWTADGSAFTASKQDSSIVVHGSDVTIVLEPGATTTIADEIISEADSGGLLVHGGNTATFESAEATAVYDFVAVTTLLQDGHQLVASVAANEDSIVVQQGSGSSFTLAAGEQTVVDGETVSVARSGGALVVMNANETLSPSLLAASTTAEHSKVFMPRKSSSGTAAESGVAKSAGETASDDGGDSASSSSSSSTAEVDNVSGGVGRASIGFVSRLSLFVLIVACVGLLG